MAKNYESENKNSKNSTNSSNRNAAAKNNSKSEYSY